MGSLKSLLSKHLYKSVIKLKPILVKVVPYAFRQKMKYKMLKYLFPIKNKTKKVQKKSGVRGINLIGYSRAEMGIGESCRIAASSIDTTDVPFGIINYTGTNPARMNDSTWIQKEILQPKYDINIFHINAEQMIEVYAEYGNSLFNNRYNIGYWHWELPDFPDEWKESFNLVDEIWVPSTFVAESISMKSPIPVVKIPHSINVRIDRPRTRAEFGLPEKSFLFLTMYDLKSFQARKNPQASIYAFKKAFNPDDDRIGLVIKANSADPHLEELVELRQLIGDYPNIYLICETLSRNDINALLAVTDSFISLHRSEGFGLGLAEAMYLGKPVIGTNWSSNVDFMNSRNSCLVDYKLVPLNNDYGPYKSYQHWAEPDHEHAAWYMKRLFEDREFYDAIASEGEYSIKKDFSPEAVGRLIKKRLDYISLWNFGG
ncbi:glycosyltransferase family 4 protein [Paenibacillus solani]|uniref:glycosyltransferase family 4 protein n=1 Tax=Paenibacillus solani TaxID=1705565 RepID=UPI003D28E256